ncbi:2-oxoglutarate dehydrogenase E1 component [Bradyrhizobium embrapense]
MSRQDANAAFALSSFLQGTNAAYIDDLYARYEQDPASVDAEWQDFFKSLKDAPADVQKNAEGASWGRDNWPVTPRDELTSALDGNWAQVEKAVGIKLAAKAQAKGAELSDADVHQATRDSVRALMLIRAYRMRGHFHAKLDPLGIEAPRDREELDPRSYGFSEADFDRKIFLDHVLGLEYGTLREIVQICERTYCQTLGVEFMHISNAAQKAWIQERIEGPDKEISFTPEGRRAILNKLIEADGFEKFCDTKFTGTKRFGLDGGESLIPALEQIIKRGGNLGVKEIVVGMPHRGRLNVLTQVMGKPHRALFHEFKGGSANPDSVEGSGDVKYHLGASSDREFDGNNIHLSLTANPSHLEIVDPVVMGKVRAKQDQHGDPPDMRISVLPLLMHGDAAFAGQGVVAECFSLSDLKGYRTGGSLHFIVNNQIGFTTYPRYSRSSPYPSDVAKMIDAPIFHVNGDDPEAVVFAAKVAIEFRQKFHKPVVIDMFCYRRHGHNEGDEPAFTQPVMYKKIASHPSTLEIYAKRLVADGVLTEGEVEKAKADWRARLDAELEAGSGYKPNKADWLDGKWAGFKSADQEEDARRGVTGVDVAVLKEIGRKITKVPDGFRAHRTIQRFLDNRAKAIDTGVGIDWATGEALAFCTLLQEGHHVRLSGQDSRARHVLAAPFGPDRSGGREPLHAVQPSRRRGYRPLRGHQLAAVGRGGARLRVRLLARRAECADALGSPVRRLRQRCAGSVRPVHLLGRTQMAAHVGPRLPAAAWLRGAGTGALLRAPRALFADVRRGQHAGGQSDHAGKLLPRVAAPAASRNPQATDPDDAEVAAASQARRVAARRARQERHLPPHPVR